MRSPMITPGWASRTSRNKFTSNLAIPADRCRGCCCCARAGESVGNPLVGCLLSRRGTRLLRVGLVPLDPEDEPLVWDRLPIMLAFMALFSALVTEHLGAGFERGVLAPAVAAGIGSGAWWDYTDDLPVYSGARGPRSGRSFSCRLRIRGGPRTRDISPTRSPPISWRRSPIPGPRDICAHGSGG